jgi:NAD(P)-dependent dehydrogenase (short-subunit alcohol dehydrogenase family)
MADMTVIVTGGSRGLGRATARIVAQMGANVVLAARSKKALQEVADEITREGGRALAVAGDLRHPENCRRVVEEAVTRFGGLNGLVNNAGILGPLSSIADAEPAAWMENWEINVLSPLMLTKFALPHLRAGKGRIVHISTGMAVNPVSGTSAYNMAKAALNMLNATLALEEPAVTTIALRPGGVDTDLQATLRAEGAGAMDPEVYRKYSTRKLLQPEVPGRAVATLVMYAPHEWNGKFISYDDEEVQALVGKYK